MIFPTERGVGVTSNRAFVKSVSRHGAGDGALLQDIDSRTMSAERHLDANLGEKGPTDPGLCITGGMFGGIEGDGPPLVAASGPVIPGANSAGPNKGCDAKKLLRGGTSAVGGAAAFVRGGAVPPAIATHPPPG